MKVKFGASLLSWITPIWTPEAGRYAIEKTAKAGFDLIEILLPPSMDFDSATVKQQLAKYHIDAVCSLNLPQSAHIPFYPKQALTLIKQAIDKTSDLGINFLGGVLHGGLGVFSGHILTESEKAIIVEVWGEVADYAESRGVNIGIEPVNRYESYVCNTAQNVLDLIERTTKENLFLHLDTFHMNIEENDFYHPVILAGKRLKHVHMTDSHRGMLGEGTVNWDQFFTALKEIDFEGHLVLENFSSSIPGMQKMVSLWQDSPYQAEELAIGSLHFMRKYVERYGS
ncbi:TIM barrel protein [Elizabethkingia argentiflava]|uniref:TIM barrel protein n=1 Tax=Elizabethkingia argenteiflava TaxID=2681556 RepID=A0A845PX72_9FLAO|nr:sugar phosphate isomerase/epimerase family protein [Elizabethkingia argenteiflava]NAW52235.1 TIM barrel protein [Elizabethkingia argenteiflava]